MYWKKGNKLWIKNNEFKIRAVQNILEKNYKIKDLDKLNLKDKYDSTLTISENITEILNKIRGNTNEKEFY